MKKLSIIACLIVSILLVAMVAWAAPIGKITGVTGNVDIMPAGDTQARKLITGDTVNTGDIIRTKGKSRVEVSFNDGNILRLAENTRLKISDYMSGKDKNVSVISLLRGKIQNTVKNIGGAGGRYEVHTPTSVCGVRGTILFNYHLNGISGALFEKGEGYVYNSKMPQDIQRITAGHAMIVSGENQAPQLRVFTPGELNTLKQETNPSSGVFQSLDINSQPGERRGNTLEQYIPTPGETKPYIPPPPLEHGHEPPVPPEPPTPRPES